MQMVAQSTLLLGAFNIAVFLFAVIIIVFVHEMGHFLLGRWSGVNIEAFSIGFGKEIFGFTDKRGTRWKFAWIPLGGYVKFEGDANAASMPDNSVAPSPTSLQGAKVWKRFLIVLAGPVSNFILAILIFAAAFSFVGTPVTEPRVDEVLEGSAAQAAGLKPGDFVRSIDGQETKSFGDIQDAMLLRGTEPATLVVERGGQSLNVTLTPKEVEIEDALGSKVKMTQIGIKHDPKNDPQGFVKSGPIEAVQKGVHQTWFVASSSLQMVGKILIGSRSTTELHGPVAVAKVAGQAAMLGPWVYITFIAWISISIGLVNLFPIPMLDGGHLVFYLIEGVIGRPVSPVAQEWSFRIGLSAILMLMILVSTNDVLALFHH
ncbi:MAG: RIP metalloprotease RseP [Alphaproteobacteria bacterium]|nr:RIP metalloprotease RseP [Alphaproteobacteria bacterium]